MRKSPFGPNVINDDTKDEPIAIPGNEGAFEVIATGGSSSGDLAPGDWVIPLYPGFGTWRSHVLLSSGEADLLWKIPFHLREKGVTALQAASVAINPLTALRMVSDFGTRFDADTGVEKQGLREDEWLLQNGANSSVGRLVIQFARLKGFRTLNVIRPRKTPEETEVLRQELLELGADIVVTDDILGKPLTKKLADASNGQGASLMLDCVGGKAAVSLARSLNEGGEVVTYGGMSRQAMTPGAGMLIFKDIRFRGFWVSRWGMRFPKKKMQDMEYLLDLMVKEKIETGSFIEVGWDVADATGREKLVDQVQKTLSGFKKGKMVFTFK